MPFHWERDEVVKMNNGASYNQELTIVTIWSVSR